MTAGYLGVAVIVAVIYLVFFRRKHASRRKNSKLFGPVVFAVVLVALAGGGKNIITRHPPSVSTYTPPGNPAGNVALGKTMAASYGWGSGSQWNCLYTLWERESGWSATALNSSSRATGIPQLLPSAHTIPAGWSSPRVQIAWGLSYLKSRWGSPCGALAVYCNHPGGPPGCWY